MKVNSLTEKRHHGKECPKHPELKGLRLTANRRCIQCSRDKRQANRKPLEERRKIKQDWDFMRLYGISRADFAVLLASQRGKCQICQTEPKRPVLDHCHTTNKIRGVLCAQCNSVLGMAHDNKAVLRRAAAYLDWYENLVA